MKLIYLSGPITKGNPETNFNQAALAQKLLMEAGYAVINPMLTMKHPNEKEISWDVWLAMDLKTITRVDEVIRLPGLSAGGDKECNFARSINTPVLYAYEVPCLAEAFPVHHENVTE